MLLTRINFPLNVQKNLYNQANLDTKQKLSTWLWSLINNTTIKLYFLPPIAITTAKIYQMLQWLPQNLNENFTLQYCYVFAGHEPRRQDFFQQMDKAERDALLRELKSNYQEILINYFTTDKNLKVKIDKFVNAVFCANIPVPQIIEIHMEVIEEFSKQLRLEGRSDETLLDYRLTLIDILANLCETYRCSMYK
ncbi:hypothetical protein [Fortiea contorta]|uniref:hypothetical protein n=1 Tax=Fortiea contorta TaxID=1892405 RepID=UPI000349B9A0|nr:hypothetical protein [Fortiea contorta]